MTQKYTSTHDIMVLCNTIQNRIFDFLLYDLKWYQRAYWRIRGYDAYHKYINRV